MEFAKPTSEKYQGKKFVPLRKAELPDEQEGTSYGDGGTACVVDLAGDRRIELALVFKEGEEKPTGIQVAIYRPTLKEDEISCFGFRLSPDAAVGLLACLQKATSLSFLNEALERREEIK